MLRQHVRVNETVNAVGIPLQWSPLPADMCPAEQLSTGVAIVAETPVGRVGVWEHPVGVSTDVEQNEVFVVLSGRGRVVLHDGREMELAPGFVGVLEAGTATTWIVDEPLRKVWITAAAPAVHHVTISVRDAAVSADWYEALLGPSTRTHREGAGWRRIRMSWPNGLVIGATQHDGTGADDCFDHARIGLDHLGLGCTSEDAVRAWALRMDELGVVHGPVEDVAYGWAVTARDPDGIPVEFFCPK